MYLLKQSLGKTNIKLPPINSKARLKLEDGCHLDIPDDDLMTVDELLEVKVTHSVFDTSFPLVVGMEYQGRIYSIMLRLTLLL
jgi:hypothetical protein